MSKDEILAGLLELPPDERQGVIRKAMDSLPDEYVFDPMMTPELRGDLEMRDAEILKYPERESSWEEVTARLLAPSRET